MLSGDFIHECKTYKYLGIQFNRTLSDTEHVQTYLKPKFRRLIGYMCSILASHNNVNRVMFGDSLWKNVLLPSLSHGCPVWLSHTKTIISTIKSMQHSTARAILRIKSTPSCVATLGELGWLPCEMILNKLRVRYFNRLKHVVPENRLCKHIVNDLNSNFHGKQAFLLVLFERNEKHFS